MLIMVHSHNCMHCIHFLPTWNAVSRELASKSGMNTMTMEVKNLRDDDASSTASKKADAQRLYSRLSNDVQAVPYIAIWYPDGSTEKFADEQKAEKVLLFVQDSLATKVASAKQQRVNK